MHFFRRISVKNIDALITIQYIINIDALITIQYINDWVKGLWIYSSCDARGTAYRDTWYWVKGLRICHACARAVWRGYRWRYIVGTAGGTLDTAGGSEYLRSGRG